MTTSSEGASGAVEEERLAAAVARARELLSEREGSPGDPFDCRRARAELEKALADGLDDRADPTDVRNAAVILALSWYADAEINPQRGADEALEVLNRWFDLRTVDDVEVLMTAGEIHERRWELSAQWRELRRALYIYERADRLTWAGDDVLQAAAVRLKAAFLLDSLARQEERALHQESQTWAHRVPVLDADHWVADTHPPALGNTALALRDEARQLRTQLVARLDRPENRRNLAADWEYYLALAEANVGLRDFERAGEVLEAGSARRPVDNDRALQAQAKRLIELSRMRGIRPEADGELTLVVSDDQIAVWNQALEMHRSGRSYDAIAKELDLDSDEAARSAVLAASRHGAQTVIQSLLRQPDGRTLDEDMVHSAFRGRLGLALSGGGFRASLFHIGVLARLAEEGLLREVQVLSCVSGGSILGAQYYLLVKRLLESTSDEELKRQGHQPYIELVQDLVRRYDDIMRSNLRARIFLNPLATAGLWPSPSRRMGRLVHKHLLPGDVIDLRDIRITPKDWTTSGPFKPRRHNWRRAHKVPVLILNATSLNTGHNWQFTARHVGEPPSLIPTEIDSGARLGRIELQPSRRGGLSRILDRRPNHQKGSVPAAEPPSAGGAETVPISLGEAVAASAAVPGLFQPLQVAGLYPDWLLKLADGGVVDNQGIGGLLDQASDTMLISDASRQLRSSPAPAGGLGPVFRSNSIAYHRIRAAQYDELRTRRRGGLVRDFLFVHLNRSLDGPEIAPRTSEADESSLDLGRSHRSGPRRRPRQAPVRRDGLRLRRRHRAAPPRLRPPGWVQQMALAVLRDVDGPMTVDEIAREIPAARPRQVVNAVASLVAQGHVERRPGSDLHRLTSTGQKLGADPITSYGIARSIQTLLAQVRTDLNDFTQAEGHALMVSGYLMTGEALAEHGGIGPYQVGDQARARLQSVAVDETSRARWPFLALIDVMGAPSAEQADNQYRLERHLRGAAAGSRLQGFNGLGSAVPVLALVALAVLLVATQDVFSTRIYNVPVPRMAIGIGILALVGGVVSGWWARRTRRAPMRPFVVLAQLSVLPVALILSIYSLVSLLLSRLPDRGRVERFLRGIVSDGRASGAQPRQPGGPTGESARPAP